MLIWDQAQSSTLVEAYDALSAVRSLREEELQVGRLAGAAQPSDAILDVGDAGALGGHGEAIGVSENPLLDRENEDFDGFLAEDPGEGRETVASDELSIGDA